MQRREFLGALAMAGTPPALIDTHVHLFEPDRFPYHEQATYRPPAEPLAKYVTFVKQAGITHTVIVHPEPYQDDHRYLEYCFENESPKDLFKGTCLFDPADPATPGRMRALVKKWPGRIVALRIHAVNEPGEPFLPGPYPIKNRDLSRREVWNTWKAAGDLGLAIQVQLVPQHAPAVARLAGELTSVPVIIDHLGRPAQGTPADFENVVKLSRLRNVYIKFSGVNYSSKEEVPYADAARFVRPLFEAFGPQRMIWGGLGHSMEQHAAAQRVFAHHFASVSEDDKARIRGGTAARLFGW